MRDYRVAIPAGRSVTLCSGQNTYIICRDINTSSPNVPSVDVMAFSSVEAGRVVIDANFIASRWFRAKDADAFTDVVATNNNLFDIECVFSIGRGEIADNVSAGDTFISGISSDVLPISVNNGRKLHSTYGTNGKASSNAWFSLTGLDWQIDANNAQHSGNMLITFQNTSIDEARLGVSMDGVAVHSLMVAPNNSIISQTIPLGGNTAALSSLLKFKVIYQNGPATIPAGVISAIYSGEAYLI